MSNTAKKQITAFRVDPDLLVAMRELQQRDGIPASEQMRRALRAFLESKGVLKAQRGVQPKRRA